MKTVADLVYLSMMLDDFGGRLLSLSCVGHPALLHIACELPGPVAQLLLELVTLLASAWRQRQTDSMSLQDTVTA